MPNKAQITEGNLKMTSNDMVQNDEIYNKEYRRLQTLSSQTDIVETSVSLCGIYSSSV